MIELWKVSYDNSKEPQYLFIDPKNNHRSIYTRKLSNLDSAGEQLMYDDTNQITRIMNDNTLRKTRVTTVKSFKEQLQESNPELFL